MHHASLHSPAPSSRATPQGLHRDPSEQWSEYTDTPPEWWQRPPSTSISVRQQPQPSAWDLLKAGLDRAVEEIAAASPVQVQFRAPDLKPMFCPPPARPATIPELLEDLPPDPLAVLRENAALAEEQLRLAEQARA